MELVITTRPRPDAISAGSAACTAWMVPFTLTSKIKSMSSPVMSAIRAWG